MKTRWVGLAALLMVAASLLLVRESRAGQEIVIVTGKSQIITVPFPLGEGQNSNPGVLQVVPDPSTRRITFFGRKVGSATYTVFDARSPNHRIEYDVRVVSEDLGQLRDNIQRQIGDIEGVEVNVKGDQVVVEGDVALELELERIRRITLNRGNVQNLVSLSPVALKALAKTIQQTINRPEVEARPLKGKILLEGVVYSPEQKARAEAIANSIFSQIVDVIEIQQVQRPPSRAKTIVINTHFLELSKQLLDTWSINWNTVALQPQGISGFFQQDLVNGELVGDFNTTISGTVTAFLPKLFRAKPEGIVRALANPVVTTKDGSDAKIFTGAEVPFVIGETPSGIPIVEFKKVGINMQCTAYAQGDSVDLKINLSVSDVGDVDISGGGGNGTGITESSYETSQFTRAGESVAIGGLFRVQDNVLYNKRRQQDGPAADSIFQLFLSREYTKRKSQFVVFVTPSVYDDSVAANREMKDLFNLQEVGGQ